MVSDRAKGRRPARICARNDRSYRLVTIGIDEEQDIGQGQRLGLRGGRVRSDLANIGPADLWMRSSIVSNCGRNSLTKPSW